MNEHMLRSPLRRRAWSLVVAAALLSSSGVDVPAQAPPASRNPGQSSQLFNPKDFNGIWDRSRGGSRGFSRAPGDETTPPFTARGKEVFDSYKPGYGPRAIAPALGNDPTGQCNPAGLPRALLYPRPTQFIMTPDLLVQVYSWTRVFREIWTDGRTIRPGFNPDLRRWYGYSAGRWEGNTLVVDSAGFDSRAWIDQFGYPMSEQMRLEERYTRINYNTIELKMTITDPVIYARPWTSETKTYTLVPREEVVGWYEKMTDLKGWYGVMEEICAPIDEVENFNRRVRDPAAGIPR
jgi:hypothetical protein